MCKYSASKEGVRKKKTFGYRNKVSETFHVTIVFEVVVFLNILITIIINRKGVFTSRDLDFGK